jgi:hypothetical protein
MVFAADYPFLEVMFSTLLFICWMIWLWMVIMVLSDVFRRDDLSGWGKVGWTLLILILPFLGVFVYLISQGKEMAARRGDIYRGPEYRSADHPSRAATEIREAKELLDSGVIDADEFESLKRKALA